MQHIESRKAQVEAIGGITVRETVPDAILERAAAIELVDITPAELLKRLSEGKVYLGDKAEAAAANFFHEDRLTALRELALRLTAEKVDSDLHDMLATGGTEGWKPAERLMVAVSHSPYSEGLVRATRRLAFGLNAPWLAVYVDTGAVLSPGDRATLAKNLQLVQELGGELVSTADASIPGALERVARQRDVTQLVVGRPTRRWRDFFSGGTILDQLARQGAGYDILVRRPDPGVKAVQGRRVGGISAHLSLRPYLLACGTVAVIALLNWFLLPVIGYKAAGFLFLLSVMAVSLFVTTGAVAVTAILSAAVWDYFFIPPYGSVYISRAEDLMMVCSYFVAALVTGMLTHRIQTRQRLIRQREDRTEILYDFAKSLVAQSGVKEVMTALTLRLQPLLQGELDLICAVSKAGLASESVLGRAWLRDDKERAVALWAHEHGRSVGWTTDTLPSSSARYLQIRSGSGTALGVLAFRPDAGRRLTQDEENLLLAVAYQLALSLERERLRAETQETDRLRESERLLQAVMDSVSHELRTPLTAISGTASALSADEVVSDPVRRRQLTEELLVMTERLNRVVGNLLDMSRLSSGVMTLQKDWHDPLDLVSTALEITHRETADRDVRTQSDSRLPLVRVDFQLLTQAVANIICNAATYTSAGSVIDITCRAAGDAVTISVSDQGPGIDPDALPMIFDKFYRGSDAKAGGVGLGLAITKAIVEAHGGSVTAANRTTGGARFTISLPVETQPEIPPETDAQ